MDPVSEMAHRIRIHDFTFYARPNADGFSLGDIPGIGMYPDRSALLPGTCFLDGGSHTDVAEEHLYGYLHVLGIGANEIRFVKGDSLFEGILNDPVECERLCRELSNGVPTTLEAFSASDQWDRFVGALNIDPSRLRTPATSVMRTLDDKESIRRLAHTLGLDDVFPKHVFTLDAHETLVRINEFRDQFPRLIVVKRPDLESGVGQLLIDAQTTEEQIFAYVHEYCTGHRPIIVEEGVFGIEGSVQWHVSPKGCEPRFFSLQYTQAGTHQGNVIAPTGVACLPDEWPLAWRMRVVEKIWATTETFVKWVAARGFIGPIGFDFILNKNAFSLLECNARTTAATYLESVRWQIEQRGHKNVTAAMKNAYPKRALTWKDAVRMLEQHPNKLAFNKETGVGVIVANPRLFHLDAPKCLLISVGTDIEQAEAYLECARKIL
ncbi:hypothetical protein A2318_03850 [Candidatus Uhrbacteria bacterium RIFOXYB2_FULL_45_11]|uniref:ATP-grasp domain-containing protein n=1 Tax=Candidatus Uhrbacteria bacterium RIFOXYB2_FULL_45_11 TaxID=1802421 RepID=A0A1F7W938_9BACT|nr:MAG: hypothetical protein A2318_03850 [Candidatus Uhrbacteria bacterium RIFOXYB2_FULL_45_11]